MTKVGIFGATGRVGRLLVELLANHDSATLGSIMFQGELDLGLPAHTVATNDVQAFLNACDVVIDFSAPQGTQELLTAALSHPKPLIIGTTGLESHQLHLMREASEKMPVLYATNMSLGVALLNKLVALASAGLRDFDIEIVEMHHRHKKDAPSGTALTLAQSAATARGQLLDEVRISGRNGNIGARAKDEISVMALRGGDIVGEHTVGFYNDGEFVRLSHTATNRGTFAQGALKAALWLQNKEAGMYNIADCLEMA